MGLLCTMALALAMFTYGIDKVTKLLPINYVYVTAIGLLFSIGTAFSGVVVGKNFFKHHFTHIHVPIMGEMELHTAAIFDLGVYFVVVGVLMSVILAFGRMVNNGILYDYLMWYSCWFWCLPNAF